MFCTAATVLLACLALLDTAKAESHVHRAHRLAHGRRAAAAEAIDHVARRYLERDVEVVVTETIYETTYVDWTPSTAQPSTTSTISQTVLASTDSSAVVVYSSVFVIPVPLKASGTPVTNTFVASNTTPTTSPSFKSSSTESKKKTASTSVEAQKADPKTTTSTPTTKMIIPSVNTVAGTAAAILTTLLTSNRPAAPTGNPSYANVVTDAISAMGASFSTSSLQWTNVKGWIAANAYNDIMDYDFYTKSKTFSSTYGSDLLSIATTPSLQGTVLSTDGFNDDQLWWCLAMLRAYQNYAQAPLLSQTITQFKSIQSRAQLSSSDAGTTPSLGGLSRSAQIPPSCDVAGAVYWSSQPSSSINAISTSLFAQVGAQLFEITGDTSYRAAADAALGWLSRVMLSHSTGVMNVDSVTLNDGCVPHPGSLTYNTGVYIGALTSLYRATGDDSYLTQATQSMTASATGAFGNDADAPLVIQQQADITSTGDDVQWRDALFRNMIDFYVSLVPKGVVDADLQGKINAFFKANYGQVQAKAKFGDGYAANWFGEIGEGSDWGTASVLSLLNGAMMIL